MQKKILFELIFTQNYDIVSILLHIIYFRQQSILHLFLSYVSFNNIDKQIIVNQNPIKLNIKIKMKFNTKIRSNLKLKL